jgi:hypothetical protein
MDQENKEGWEAYAFTGSQKERLTSPTRALNKRSDRSLLNRAADLGKHVVGIRPNESDRPHDDHQNHSQHHCVFRYVLSTLIVPELL